MEDQMKEITETEMETGNHTEFFPSLFHQIFRT